MRPLSLGIALLPLLIFSSPASAQEYFQGQEAFPSQNILEVSFLAQADPDLVYTATITHEIGASRISSPPICFRNEGGYADFQFERGSHIYASSCANTPLSLVTVDHWTGAQQMTYAFRQFQDQRYTLQIHAMVNSSPEETWEIDQIFTSEDLENVSPNAYAPPPPPGTEGQTQSSQPDSEEEVPENQEQAPTIVTSVSFEDIDPDTDLGSATRYLSNRGVIQGVQREDGRYFLPEERVNRAEALKMVMHLAYRKDLPGVRRPQEYSDVDRGDWFYEPIIFASNLGIVEGYPDGRFGPADEVQSAQLLKILSLTYDLPPLRTDAFSDVDDADWFSPYVGNEVQYNLGLSLSPEIFSPERPLSRGEVAVALWRLSSSLEN